MKHLWKAKRKKSPEHPLQPISPGNPVGIAARPPGLQTELSAVPEDERGGLGPQIVSLAKMDVDQDRPASGSSTSGRVIGGTRYRDKPIVEDTNNSRGEESERAQAFRVAKKVHKGTLLNDPTEDAEKFNPLKVVLGAIPAVCANRQESGTVTKKIEILLLHIVLLEDHFDSCPDDVAERRRRDELIREFKKIKGQLEALCGNPESQLTDHAQDDERLLVLLDDLQEVISNYQMARQQSIDNEEFRLMDPAEATALNNVHCAQQAEYRHGDRNGCLKGTRSTILDEIELWTHDFYKPPLYWLNGLAGTGKSTIAQTIAERMFGQGRLGASFFCSRDFEDRSNLKFIFPTLAVQLARKYSEFRSILIPLVRSDPEIIKESLYGQMNKLIVQPLVKSAVSPVIVIDALDECKDDEPASAILSVLAQFVSEIPKAKFLITGRPEPRIREGFRLPSLEEATDVFVLHEVEPNQVDSDIRLFFRHKFSDLVRRRRGLDSWPSEEQLDVLCKRAGGLFVYAVATVKFIDKQSTSPRKQLDLLLQSPESSLREARMKLKADTTLDSLYTSILQGAFGDEDDPDNDPKVRSVLGATILAANPLSPSTIAMLLGFDIDEVFPLLSSVQSLLILQEDIDLPVRPFHKSFPDFITDPDRCTNLRFHVSPPYHHPQLLLGCLELMDRSLEKNMCRLPDGVANSDVVDLKERIERYIDPALQYACRSWHTHLACLHVSSANSHEITSTLHQFLERKFPFWLEVLSVLCTARNAVDALQAVVDLLEEPRLLDLASDCYRFTVGYFEIIHASSQHIYHSALMLAPKTSIVRKLYEPHSQHFARIVQGVPESWDSTTAAATFPYPIYTVAWSPCNRFIAICTEDPVRVDMLDSTTLQRLQRLDPPWERDGCFGELIFSPDGRRLTYFGCCAHRVYSDNVYLTLDENVLVLTWDLQTGGIVSTIVKSIISLEGPFFIAYSMDGKMVAAVTPDRPGGIISFFNVTSGSHTHDVDCCQLGKSCSSRIWTHGESVRFATAEPRKIAILEVGFLPGTPTTEVKTFPGPDSVRDLKQLGFIPASYRAVFVYRDRVLVWDTQDAKSLLLQPDINPSPQTTFSLDGRFFAYLTTGSQILLWKESSTGFTLHETLSPSGNDPIPLLSPNGKSIVTFGGPMVQLWHTSSFTATPPNTSIHPSQGTRDFAVDFLPDRSLAVVVRREDNTVTVLDLESGIPRLTIETSMEVYGLRAINKTIAAIGRMKVIVWNVPEGTPLPDARLTVEDSAQTIDLTRNHDRILSTPITASMSLDSRFVVVILRERSSLYSYLFVYEVPTGQLIDRTRVLEGIPWFTSGDKIWCIMGEKRVKAWKITGEGLKSTVGVDDIECGPWGCPWTSARGYKVLDDLWVLGLDGKRLMMLPPPWRSDAVDRVWNEQFLILLHGTLPEPVIIKLEL